MGKKVFLVGVLVLILIPFVFASDFGYDNPNLPNIPPPEEEVITIINRTTYDINSSDYWDDINIPNATQMETANQTLSLLESWFKTLWDVILGTKSTDDLTEGSTNFYDNRTWNETKLAVTYYNATSITVLDGTHDAGDLESIQTYDEESYNVSEAVGIPAMDIRVNFTGVTDFNELIVRMKTTDAGKHRYSIQIYDYVLGGWEDYTNFVEVDTYKVMSLGVYDSADHLNGGVVAVRFYLGDSGIPAHKVFLDWVELSLGPVTFSTNEIDPLSFHRGENLNNTGFNISANYFFGDGSLLTGISATSVAWNRTGTDVFLHHTGDSVGIGTASPDNLLHVNGTNPEIIVSGNFTPAAKTRLANYVANSFFTHNAYYDGSWHSNDPATGSTVVNIGAGVWRVRTADATGGADGDPITLSEKMRVHTDGNVGIGTASPQANLDVNGTIRAIGTINPASGSGLEMHYTAGNSYLISYNRTGSVYLPLQLYANDISFGVAGQIRMFINQTLGNVGIGTTSPLANLHIAPPVGGADTVLRISDPATTYDPAIELYRTTGSLGARIYYDNSAGILYLTNRYDHATGDIRFQTKTTGTPVDAMTIDGNGLVGIGTTSPSTTLDVEGNAWFGTTWKTKIITGNQIDFSRDATNYITASNATGSLAFGSGGRTNDIVIQTDGDFIVNTGDVGIGTDSPTHKLNVVGDSNFTGNVNVTGNLGLNVQYITCANGAGCDEDAGATLVQDSCPSGYILTGCTNSCYDAGGLDGCSAVSYADLGYCISSCLDGAGGQCSENVVRMYCMRITDIGDA